MEYEWEDVPFEPTSVALANLKAAIGCTCEDIPDIAWNKQYYCIKCGEVEVNLGAKVKVNSSSVMARLLAKSVGSRGVFHFDPTPVDKSVSC